MTGASEGRCLDFRAFRAQSKPRDRAIIRGIKGDAQKCVASQQKVHHASKGGDYIHSSVGHYGCIERKS